MSSTCCGRPVSASRSRSWSRGRCSTTSAHLLLSTSDRVPLPALPRRWTSGFDALLAAPVADEVGPEWAGMTAGASGRRRRARLAGAASSPRAGRGHRAAGPCSVARCSPRPISWSSARRTSPATPHRRRCTRSFVPTPRLSGPRARTAARSSPEATGARWSPGAIRPFPRIASSTSPERATCSSPPCSPDGSSRRSVIR